MKEEYTISIFTEHHIGLLHRVTTIFTRRHINIESITASESEVNSVYRYTIVVNEKLEQVEKVVKQIQRQVEVIHAFFHRSDEIVHQEIALYKLPIKAIHNGVGLEKIMREHHARILTVEKDFLIIEKTGHQDETQALLERLEPMGLREFVRSGRVAIMKQKQNFSEVLHELEKSNV